MRRLWDEWGVDLLFAALAWVSVAVLSFAAWISQ